MKNKLLAAIDIGTNTFRLLIAEVQPDVNKMANHAIKEIYSERIITRLVQGVLESGIIKKKAMIKGIVVLNKFSDIIARYGVFKTSAIATSALRDAKNRDDFLKKAKEATMLDIEIVSGDEEARLTSFGMLIGIKPFKTAVLADIGGGSTELIFVRNKKPELVHSLKLGVVYLADKYMKNDPPLKKDLNQTGKYITRKIASIIKTFRKLFSKETVFIGTAGTVTALSAISQHLTKYEHNKIHNSRITIKKVRSIFSAISTIPAKERVKYHPLEQSRLDIIVPGTLILLKLMETFGFKEVIVSNYGLREGILIDLYDKNKK